MCTHDGASIMEIKRKRNEARIRGTKPVNLQHHFCLGLSIKLATQLFAIVIEDFSRLGESI